MKSSASFCSSKFGTSLRDSFSDDTDGIFTPGPGSYKTKSDFKPRNPHQLQTRKTTFGVAKRTDFLTSLQQAGHVSANTAIGPGGYTIPQSVFSPKTRNVRCGYSPAVPVATTRLKPHKLDHPAMFGEQDILDKIGKQMVEKNWKKPKVPEGSDSGRVAFHRLSVSSLDSLPMDALSEAQKDLRRSCFKGRARGRTDSGAGFETTGTWRFMQRPAPQTRMDGGKLEMITSEPQSLFLAAAAAQSLQRKFKVKHKNKEDATQPLSPATAKISTPTALQNSS